MIKKNLVAAALLAMTVVTGCGSSATSTRNTQTNQVEKVLEQQTSQNAEGADTVTPQPFVDVNTQQDIPVMSEEDMKKLSEGSDVDIDLTKMSKEIVYASVFNITNTPDKYMGNTIRMKGQVAYTYSEETGLTYANVVIADAAACCAQGIEFQLEDKSLTCPEGYPAEGTEVIVEGTLESYNEGELTYYRAGSSKLVNA